MDQIDLCYGGNESLVPQMLAAMQGDPHASEVSYMRYHLPQRFASRREHGPNRSNQGRPDQEYTAGASVDSKVERSISSLAVATRCTGESDNIVVY